MATFVAIAGISAIASVSPIQSYFPLPESLVQGLTRRGVEVATPIQHSTFARAALGESVLLHSETDSGKTLAIKLPALYASTRMTARSWSSRERESWQRSSLMKLAPLSKMVCSVASHLRL